MARLRPLQYNPDFTVSFERRGVKLPLERTQDIFPSSLYQTYLAPFDKSIVLRMDGGQSREGYFKLYMFNYGERPTCSESRHAAIITAWKTRNMKALCCGIRGGKVLTFEKCRDLTFQFINGDGPFPPCPCPMFFRIVRTIGSRKCRKTYAFRIREQDMY